MSLLASATRGSTEQPYFIENIGGAGLTAADAPCIKGTTLGAIRVGNPAAGLVIRGDTIVNANNIRGGQVSGGSFQIGNSTTSFQNIVLTDGLTAINGSVQANNGFAANSGLSVSGDITLVQGAAGDSISGYYEATTAPLACPDTVDTAIPLPVGLTDGWYVVSCGTPPGGQTEQQVSTLVYLTSGIFAFGGSQRTPAGSGSFGFKLSPLHTGLFLSNSTGAAQNNVEVKFSKLLN